MFAHYQPFVYLALIYLCLIVSFLNRKRDRSMIYLYFLIVGIIESFPHFLTINMNRVYTIGTFLYMLYFTFYYARLWPEKKKIIYFLGLLAICSCVFLTINSQESFPAGLGLGISIFYITLSLSWFYHQITMPDSVFIIKKQAFWVSTAILFWSVFFLFRVSPMYWLETHDLNFLLILNGIFKAAVVFTYALFLIAVTRKH